MYRLECDHTIRDLIPCAAFYRFYFFFFFNTINIKPRNPLSNDAIFDCFIRISTIFACKYTMKSNIQMAMPPFFDRYFFLQCTPSTYKETERERERVRDTHVIINVNIPMSLCKINIKQMAKGKSKQRERERKNTRAHPMCSNNTGKEQQRLSCVTQHGHSDKRSWLKIGIFQCN